MTASRTVPPNFNVTQTVASTRVNAGVLSVGTCSEQGIVANAVVASAAAASARFAIEQVLSGQSSVIGSFTRPGAAAYLAVPVRAFTRRDPAPVCSP